MFGIEDREGELIVNVENELYGDALYSFIQGIIKITDVSYLSREKIPFIVMDFNPHIVEELKQKNINVVYGDIGDPDMHDLLHLEKAKLVISTATSIDDNEFLIEECKRRKSDAKILVRALDNRHAEVLKALGADFAIQPEKISGMFLVNQLKKHWPNVVFTGLSTKTA